MTLLDSKEEERVVRLLVVDDDDAFSASRFFEEIFFLSSSQVQKKGRVSVKDTHFNTPTTNSIKYDDSKRFSLSPSLSLPLSSRKCCNKRCSKKHYCRCSFVLLREHHRVDSKDVYSECVCVLFFMCIRTPNTTPHKRLSSVF